MQYVLNNIVPEVIYLFSYKHQNIVKYFEYFATNDFFFVVTEYCEVRINQLISFKIKYIIKPKGWGSGRIFRKQSIEQRTSIGVVLPDNIRC